jgi:HEAT repeat protein
MDYESNDRYAQVKPPKFSPDDVLPQVEPPNITFLLQLFLIPLLIVSIIVAMWWLFSFLATASVEPQQILREIRQDKESSWQRAVTLASMLDNPDAQYAALRKDPAFARELGSILVDDLKTPLTDRASHEQRLKVRYFLCRALGNLETPEAIDPLLAAAVLDRDVAEVEVRLGALEGISLLASRLGPEPFYDHPQAMEVLLECSRASDSQATPLAGQSPDYRPHGEVRGAAAFALGVIGGERALNRLAAMLEDPYPNARYNAATGLARQGDARAIVVIQEMLDPTNELVAREEHTAGNQDNQRAKVIRTGIEAAVQLAEQQSSEEAAPMRRSLEALVDTRSFAIKDTQLQTALRLQARDALSRFPK